MLWQWKPWFHPPPANTSTVTREKAGVAWVRVELAEAEGAVWALGQGAGRVLVEQLGETPPASEVDPELVEEVTVKEVMPVGDWREKWRRKRLRGCGKCMENILRDPG